MDTEMQPHDHLENGTAEPQFDQLHQNNGQNNQKRSYDSFFETIKQENPDVAEVTNSIGSGGQCVGVYKIRHIHGEYRALKVVKKNEEDDTKNEDTRKEIQMLKKLPKNSFVQLKKFKETKKHFYIHMELME